MKLKCEVSKPHYHPSKAENTSELTVKRRLSVPPHWVANERLEDGGKSYAIVMPPRDESLFEDRQEVHIHFPEYVWINVDGAKVKARVKVQSGQPFEPVVHFDDVEAEMFGIESGKTEAVL